MLTGALIATGCSSPGAKGQKSANAVTGIQQTRADVVKARQEVGQAVAAASALQKAQGDLRPAYARLDSQIKKVESEAARLKAKNTDMKKRAKAYQDQWQKELSAMQSETLRAAATQRATGVKERYAQIQQSATTAREAYGPFIRDLKDLRTYVSNDMTPGAINAAGPVFDKINADGKALEAALDAFIKELDDTAATMSPTSPKPTKK